MLDQGKSRESKCEYQGNLGLIIDLRREFMTLESGNTASNMPAWYPLRLDPWQLSLKYSNLPGRGFESLPESLSFFPLFIFSSLFHTFFSDFDLEPGKA